MAVNAVLTEDEQQALISQVARITGLPKWVHEAVRSAFDKRAPQRGTGVAWRRNLGFGRYQAPSESYLSFFGVADRVGVPRGPESTQILQERTKRAEGAFRRATIVRVGQRSVRDLLHRLTPGDLNVVHWEYCSRGSGPNVNQQ